MSFGKLSSRICLTFKTVNRAADEGLMNLVCYRASPELSFVSTLKTPVERKGTPRRPRRFLISSFLIAIDICGCFKCVSFLVFDYVSVQ